MTVTGLSEAPRLSIVGTSDMNVASLVPTLVFDPVNPSNSQTRSVTVANSSALDLPFRWASAQHSAAPSAPSSPPRVCASPSCPTSQMRTSGGTNGGTPPRCYNPSCRARDTVDGATHEDLDPCMEFMRAAGNSLEGLNSPGGAFSVEPSEGVSAVSPSLAYLFVPLDDTFFVPSLRCRLK